MSVTPDKLSLDAGRVSRWGIGEVLRLSAPAVLAMLNVTIVRVIDSWMVSRLGPHILSAQVVSGQAAFIAESFAFGTMGILSTFASQAVGQGNPRRAGRYGWAGIRLGCLYAMAMMPLIFFARPIMGFFGHGPETQALEAMYFQFMIFSFLFTIPARAMEYFFIGIHRPKVIVVAAITANGVNILANYALIFGRLGMPAMGLKGAAIGSCFSWALQFLILSSVFLSHRYHAVYGTRSWRMSLKHLYMRVVRYGVPAGARLCNAMLCWSIFAYKIIGGLGPAYLAGNSAVMRYGLIAILPPVGVGIAITALVGRYVGAQRQDLARRRTHVAMTLCLIYMLTLSGAMVIFRKPLIRVFVKADVALIAASSGDVKPGIDLAPAADPAPPATITPTAAGLSAADHADPDDIIAIGAWLLVYVAVFQLFDMTSIIYTGALRGAGDTFVPMILAIVFAWAFEVAGSYLMAAFLPEWGAFGPYVAATGYMICLAGVLIWRFESGVWKKNDIFKRRGAIPDADILP